MAWYHRARDWNVTEEDRAWPLPCDGLMQGPFVTLLRAVNVQAPAGLVFSWLCQLRVAPYSYDWLDNLGRQSPRRRDPSLERLEIGQRLMPFTIADFEHGRQVTGVATPRARRIFGPMAVTYAVRDCDGGSRLVMRLNVGSSGWWQRLRLTALQWGDLVMARKQLLTLKELAEREAREMSAA